MREVHVSQDWAHKFAIYLIMPLLKKENEFKRAYNSKIKIY